MTHTNEPLRKCIECGKEAHTEEELDLFIKEGNASHGRRNLCRACKRARDTKWRANNKDKVALKSKKYHALRVYGVSLEEYNECMATSDKCEVCGSTEKLGYDHCHDTMVFRGVLCNKCNRSIGQLGDTVEAIERVLNYLRRRV